jgi:hypothetical protein
MVLGTAAISTGGPIDARGDGWAVALTSDGASVIVPARLDVLRRPV